MANNIQSVSDLDKLEKMYFYMQDIMVEIVSCSNLVQMLYDFYKKSEHSCLVENQSVTVSVDKNIDKKIFITNLRVPFHTLVINIFKLGELIYQNQGFIKTYFKSDTKLKLDEFRKKYYTKELQDYRNKYVAHHRDNKKNDFLTFNELRDLSAKILGVANSSSVNWQSHLDYVQNFYTKDEQKKKSTICQIIYDLHAEVEQHLGRKLNRVLAK